MQLLITEEKKIFIPSLTIIPIKDKAIVKDFDLKVGGMPAPKACKVVLFDKGGTIQPATVVVNDNNVIGE